MDLKGYDASISDPEIHFATSIQSHKLLVDEVLQLLEKTKASLDVAHSIAMQISDLTESSKVYVSDSDVEDDIHKPPRRSIVLKRTPSKREERLNHFATGTSFSKGKSEIKVEEKPVVSEAILCPNDQVVNEMLKIFVPNLFTEKLSTNVADLL
ncbi:P-loop containing nucleoside triphosphatehydrolases superfamily protein [Striga asiatica]|uniref:P-loop containing nucleoside triphosphatehydrolases superfamily protein n=1 Tax=Striga asiatica TaxID=4170 RepID=A0A5A7PHZ4_STRAF|nr:P-loop containing nucleoside triphosphatehydrolases superfamily protein [Striga asiatica]